MTTPGDFGEPEATDPTDPTTPSDPATPQPTDPAAQPDAAGAPAATPRRKHAAEEAGLRLPAWMLAIGALIVVGLVVWLIIGLSRDDDPSGPADDSVSVTTTRSASAASLPSLLCTGPSYVVLDTGQPEAEMLQDVSATEAQFPGSRLSTVPGGCIPGSSAVDEVVLALGPFDTFEGACQEADDLHGVPYKVYAGSADEGLVETSCP